MEQNIIIRQKQTPKAGGLKLAFGVYPFQTMSQSDTAVSERNVLWR
ncbi:conserved hypothetical protein [Porphyromonas gingivalis ATCC 33277]|uniref:Uncharacterized protein n=1 Tax=Porphyromonas gingivalis (strain ATCC 33277 / DSM 20709 / CIP 103683 / JCM 12257 / NCTC 11834 / 2561) TaxID=431947 RepID=B2RIE3_PORG3|nr:conserved hypothetical protein [Porphyromonas gingivalis ATCC 33277]